MKIGIVSQAAGRPDVRLEDLVGEARRAERDGFAFYSLPSVFGKSWTRRAET